MDEKEKMAVASIFSLSQFFFSKNLFHDEGCKTVGSFSEGLITGSKNTKYREHRCKVSH